MRSLHSYEWVRRLLMVLMLPVTGQVVELIQSFFMPIQMPPVIMEWVHSPWGLLYICILGPVIEELLFRVAFQGWLLQRRLRVRPLWAVLFSSVLFAMCHGFGVQFLAALVCGVLLGWYYIDTQGPATGIVAHIVNNSLAACLLM